MPKKKMENMTEMELSSLMRDMGDAITEVAQRRGIEKPLFTLLLWNDPKVAQYMANCERADAIAALRETADRLDKGKADERVSFGKPI